MLYCRQEQVAGLVPVLARFGLRVHLVEPDSPIPGSYWGAPEAGIIHNCLYVRGDTPLHSALHEACHYICMDSVRRQHLHTDAGGDYEEENGVCYLQILLADHLSGVGRTRILADMDEWGYTFRLGSARAWLESDAADTRQWLIDNRLLDEHGHLTWMTRF